MEGILQQKFDDVNKAFAAGDVQRSQLLVIRQEDIDVPSGLQLLQNHLNDIRLPTEASLVEWRVSILIRNALIYSLAFKEELNGQVVTTLTC